MLRYLNVILQREKKGFLMAMGKAIYIMTRVFLEEDLQKPSNYVIYFP